MKRFLLSLLMLSIVAVWGWTFVIVKDAVASYGVMPFLALRFSIGAVVMLPFAMPHLTGRNLAVGAGIGFMLAAAYLFQTFGLDRTTATNAGLITGLFIVFAPLANRLVFAVKAGGVQWLAVVISLSGLVLLTGFAPEGIRGGDGLVFGCAVCFGLHIALLDRYAKNEKSVALAFGQLAATAVLFLVLCLVTDQKTEAPPAPGIWRALLITGVLASAAGFFVQTFVQKHLSAVQTAVIIALEPPCAVFFGFLLAGDRLAAVQLTGAALMVGSVFLTELCPGFRKRRNRKTAYENEGNRTNA